MVDNESLKLLLDKGASVNARNLRGETAFDVADKLNMYLHCLSLIYFVVFVY